MALKGFLASGFQKLIGASRIKGADDTFLGENNEQEFTIEEKAYLDVWESPTSSLLTDY